MLHLLWKNKENRIMFKEHWGKKVRAFIQLRKVINPTLCGIFRELIIIKTLNLKGNI